MKAVVAAFNQEKALVGAFSVITNLRMELFEALINKHKYINSCHDVMCCLRDGHGTTEHQKLRCNVDIPTTTTTAATTATNNNNSSRDVRAVCLCGGGWEIIGHHRVTKSLQL